MIRPKLRNANQRYFKRPPGPFAFFKLHEFLFRTLQSRPLLRSTLQHSFPTCTPRNSPHVGKRSENGGTETLALHYKPPWKSNAFRYDLTTNQRSGLNSPQGVPAPSRKADLRRLHSVGGATPPLRDQGYESPEIVAARERTQFLHDSPK